MFARPELIALSAALRLVAVRTAPSGRMWAPTGLPAVPVVAAGRDFPRDATGAEAFDDLAESAVGLSSAWAVPAPANATPTPNARALAPSQAYGCRRRRAERLPVFVVVDAETF